MPAIRDAAETEGRKNLKCRNTNVLKLYTEHLRRETEVGSLLKNERARLQHRVQIGCAELEELLQLSLLLLRKRLLILKE